MISHLEQEFQKLEIAAANSNQYDCKISHSAISLIHRLINELDAVKNGMETTELRSKLSEIRRIHSKSNFIKRLQEWPNGYQGDFETIEQICSVANSMADYSIGYYLEEYALNCFIAQQHRNKINIQSRKIVEAVTQRENANILICACGSSNDLRSVQNIIQNYDFNLVLNDLDENALSYSESMLSKGILNKIQFDNNNVISTMRNLKKNYDKFDLILFGGLFDYLSDKQIKFVMGNAFNHLTKRGQILFTNIAENNPFKSWIELCGNWELIERSKEHNTNICELAAIPKSKMIQYKDLTQLTNIVEVQNWL